METRANYVAIGAFVLFVIVAAVGSLYWLYRSAEPGATQLLRIVFPEPVTGLSTGGSVLFNGIRVGEVTQLEFAPTGGDDVIAITRVAIRAPIKTDTTATLGFQGLTGVAYISLTGGTQAAPSLFASTGNGADSVPTIVAQTSTFTSLLDAAQSVLGRLNTTLDEVNGIIQDNRDDLNAIVSNVRAVSVALADASPDLRGLVSDIAGAGRAIAGIVPQVGDLVDHADGLLAAIAPERLTAIVENVESFTTELPGIGTELGQYVTSIGTQLDTAAGDLGEAVQAVNTVVASLDPEEIRSIVSGLDRTVSVVANQSDNLGAFIDNAAAVSSDLRSITGPLAGSGDALAQTVANAETLSGDLAGVAAEIAARRQMIGSALDDLSDAAAHAPELLQALRNSADHAETVLAALDVNAVNAVVQDISAVASALAGQAPEIPGFVADLQTVIANAQTITGGLVDEMPNVRETLASVRETAQSAQDFSARLPGLADAVEPGLQNLSAVLSAIDAEEVSRLVSNVTAFTDTLAAQTEPITQIVTNANRLSQGAVAVVDAVAERTPRIGALIDNAAAFSQNALEISAELRPAVRSVTDALSVITAARLDNILTNVQLITTGLVQQRGTFEAVLANAEAISTDARVLTEVLAARAPMVGAIVDDAALAANRVAVAADRLPGLVARVEPGVDNLSTVLSAIDAETVAQIVADTEALIGTVAAERATIAQAIRSLAGVAQNAQAVASALAARVPQVEGAIDSLAGFAGQLPGLTDTLQPGVENLSSVLSSIDPSAVAGIVQDVARLGQALAAQAPRVEPIARGTETLVANLSAAAGEIRPVIEDAGVAVANARTASAALPRIAADLEPAMQNVAAVLSGIDAQQVAAIVANADAFAGTLAAESETVAATLRGARAAVVSLESIVSAVSARTGQIEAFITNAGESAASLRLFAEDLPGLADTVRPGLQNLSETLTAIDPDAVSAIVRDAQAISTALAAEMPKIGPIVDTVGAAVDNARVISVRLRGELNTVQDALESANAALSDARAFAARLPDLADELEPGVQNLSDALSALDPDAINAIITNVQDVTQTVADARDEIETIITTVSNAATNVESVTAVIGERSEAIRVGIDGASRFAQALGAQAPRLDTLVTNASQTLAAISSAAGEIDGQRLNEILDNLARAAQEIGSRSGEIGRAIDDVSNAARGLAQGLGTVGGETGTVREVLEGARRIVQNLEGASTQVSSVVNNADRLLAGPVPVFVSNASNAALGIQEVADAFASRADAIASGLAKFSRGGLDDLRALLNQGRVTLAAIERTVTSFDRDPSRVIFGGPNGPRYSPQRR